MRDFLESIRSKLIAKIIFIMGLALFLYFSVWSYYQIEGQKTSAMEGAVSSADSLSNTIKLGTHYAMMLNSRNEIKEIITNISKLEEVESIRIFNKEGRIKFSNRPEDIDERLLRTDPTCATCHPNGGEARATTLSDRTRLTELPDGRRVLNIVSPIYNEVGCTSGCHFHSQQEPILGVLDVAVAMKKWDRATEAVKSNSLRLAFFVFLISFSTLFALLYFLVNRPIRRIISCTRDITDGGSPARIELDQQDEMGELGDAINRMARSVGEKQDELIKQRNIYQNLFEGVPCLVTVQNRDYKLISFNRAFSDKFSARYGDHCYKAYKNRTEKCLECPVEQTFKDGQSHCTEEMGFYKDGTKAHWIVTTSPITDADGNVVAAMEMCLDITSRKQLEEELKKSEKKYYDIFNNIPNAVFVLDIDDFAVLDCNKVAASVYGLSKDELIGSSFLDLFFEEDRESYRGKLRSRPVINQARQRTRDGKLLYVSISISPSEYHGRPVLLVTTSDITKRLEAEQQLIQASKMSTLGEMSTGVAHELNQPLSVIQTSADFLLRKIRNREKIDDTTISSVSELVSKHVDRASRIINHLREFGRKPNLNLELVRLNDIIRNAFDIFSQQLTLRNIEVVWDLQEDLPEVLGEANRLEQVFINMLINARDSIEERWAKAGGTPPDKRISIKTVSNRKTVTVKICDTGKGIPKTIADRIFEPFFTTKEVGKGTGLGLSISYGIITDCGGSIHAASKEGEGACFYIHFPVPADENGSTGGCTG